MTLSRQKKSLTGRLHADPSLGENMLEDRS